MTSQPSQPKEPSVIFLFDVKNWFESISPLSKLDLFDIAPAVGARFYFDYSSNAYVLVLGKSKWDNLSSDLKRKFMLVSRRLREEMEGPMTTMQREQYENSDVFHLLMSAAGALPSTQ
jgi:hypothetical protein